MPIERPEPTAATRTIMLKRDTPVHLMVLSEVTTKSHSVGHRFKLRVNKPIIVDGLTVVPAGTFAYGEVTSAEASGNVGKSGKVSARLLSIDLTAVVGGTLAFAVTGKSAIMPAGTPVSGYLDREATITAP